MLNNVEKLTQLGIIGDIRQHLGADDENDTSFDNMINKMNNSALVEAWTGWNLGGGYWCWSVMKAHYDRLEELSK